MTKTATKLAEQLVSVCTERRVRVTTIESCTGGLIGATITEVAGASNIFEGGFITYSNEAKIDFCGVSPNALEKYGAVSAQVAEEMARGGLSKCNSRTQIATSVTGIAGPSGGTDEKPVGLVYIGIAWQIGDRVQSITHRHVFPGPNRQDIRSQTVAQSLKLLIQTLELF